MRVPQKHKLQDLKQEKKKKFRAEKKKKKASDPWCRQMIESSGLAVRLMNCGQATLTFNIL